MMPKWICTVIALDGSYDEPLFDTVEEADDYADWAINCENIGSAYVERDKGQRMGRSAS